MGLFDRLHRSTRRAFTRVPHQRMSRALVKTLLYRGFMIAITILVALFITGDTGAALSIGLVSNAIKTVTYYGYERLWDRISWGI